LLVGFMCVLAGCRIGFDELARGGDGSDPTGDGGWSGDALKLAPTVLLAAGDAHTCVITAAGAVRCWGDNAYGQLGYGSVTRIGDNEPPSTAGDVSLGGVPVQIVAGGAHTCALLENGAVRCWGDSMYGQLGYGNTTRIGDDETPASAGDVNVGLPAIQIAIGVAHSCVVTVTGGVRCWGDSMYGQLGYGNKLVIGDDETPASVGDVDLGGTATAVAVGTAHTCALMSTGAVRCWGDNMYGQLGYGVATTIGDDEAPATAGDVPLGGTAIAIAADEVHTCAVMSTGAVRCWGDNMFGQLGYGNTTRRGDDEPASAAGDVPLGGIAQEISVGIAHSCARLDTGAMRCWGDGFYGQLGYGSTTIIGDTEPASAGGDVPVGGTVMQISAGLEHTCARLTTGAVRCWGNGMFGRLGYANTQTIGDNEPASSAGDVMF